MLMFIDDVLVDVRMTPVPERDFFLVHNDERGRMELWHNSERVVSGVKWYGYHVDIDPRTGQIGAFQRKEVRVRAVFSGNSLDFPLSKPY